jgi:hypothetical protein
MAPGARFGRPEPEVIGSRSGTTEALGRHVAERIASRSVGPQART